MDYLSLLNSIKRGQFASVYLLHGEEPFLLEEGLKALREALVDPQMGDFNFDLVDGEATSLDAIVTMANTLPFMVERRLVLVRGGKYFSSKGEGNEGEETALLKYLESPSASTVLVFAMRENGDKRRKLFKAVDKAGAVVEYAPLKGKYLLEWLGRQAGHYHLVLETGVADLLVDALGGDLGVLNQELDKLSLYLGGSGRVSRELVRSLVSPAMEDSVFAMVDAIGQKRGREAVEILQDLLTLGQNPIPVLFMVARQIRLLWQTRSLTEKRVPFKNLVEGLGVRDFIARKLTEQANNFTMAQLEEALEILRNADRDIKTGQGEPRMILELTVIKLATRPR